MRRMATSPSRAISSGSVTVPSRRSGPLGPVEGSLLDTGQGGGWMTEHDEPDLALLRGMLHPRMSRRGFLRTAGVGAAGLSLSGLLAACGGTGGAVALRQPRGGRARPGPRGPPAASTGRPRRSPARSRSRTGRSTSTARRSTASRSTRRSSCSQQETDIDIHYVEAIQAYDAFFAKLRVLLEAEQPTGYDLIVMGFPKWLPLMMANDYLIPLDHSQLPNFAANAASKYQDPARTTPGTGSRSRTCRGSRASATTRSSRGERSPA